MCFNSHNIIFLFIIHCSDMIFSLIICFNSHYRFVQQGSTLFKYGHNFILFHYYEIFHLEVLWSNIHVHRSIELQFNVKKWDFDFSFNFLFSFFLRFYMFRGFGVGLSFDD
jgi:hypothetical protein